MPGFDKEIAAAKKIGQGWIKTAEGYEGVFESLKKDHLALEKGSLTDVQKAAVNKTAGKREEAELATIIERLKQFKAHGEKEFKTFDAWALKEPRKSMGFIAEQLKLGKPGSEAYDAVSKATKTQLNDVAAVISKVQRTWRSDVEIALDNNMDKAKAVHKMLNKGVATQKALLDQLTKEIARFKTECETAHGSLKITTFMDMISDMNSGKLMKLPPVQIEQKCQQAVQRVKVIPQLTQQIDKNYGRIIKSVPDNFLDGFTATGLKKKLEEIYAKSQKDMAVATKVCTTAVKKAKEFKLI